VIDTEYLHQLNSFTLILKKRLTSSFIGERRTTHVGSGLLFRDHAAYVPGDDFKHIDWKAFARTDKLFVKRFEEDRNLTVHILVDYSGSMNFGNKIKKYEYAAKIGLGFAYIALRNNERFVLSTFDGKLDLFKPKKGAQQLAEIVSYLNRRRPEGTTDFERALQHYKALINSKSIIIIISDFFYDTEAIKRILTRLKHNQIKLIQILDPIERNLNLEGDYTLIDLESQDALRTYIDPYLRKLYLEKMERHKNELVKACNEISADFHQTSTDQNLFDVFYTLLE